MNPSKRKKPKQRHNGRVTAKACKKNNGPCRYLSRGTKRNPDGQVIERWRSCSWCGKKSKHWTIGAGSPDPGPL